MTQRVEDPDYVVIAIVKDPSKKAPRFNGDYFKVVWHSKEPSVEIHWTKLQSMGYEVLSVKSHMAGFYDANYKEAISDEQGNMECVEFHKLRHEADKL